MIQQQITAHRREQIVQQSYRLFVQWMAGGGGSTEMAEPTGTVVHSIIARGQKAKKRSPCYAGGFLRVRSSFYMLLDLNRISATFATAE